MNERSEYTSGQCEWVDQRSNAYCRWLRRYRPRPAARVRLVCFPHAGGSATFFRDWADRLPPEIELLAVQYPGRGDRFAEAACHDMDALVAALVPSLAAAIDGPYALFGHSMGAAVAYETAAHLVRSGHPGPVRLFVSGREAPAHSHGGELHRREDETLAAELVRLGGTPTELLADRALQALLLPALRADYRLIETYRPGAADLDCPITAMTGDADPDVTIDEVAGWAAVTRRGAFELRIFTGDHFFLVPNREAVVQALAHDLGVIPATPMSFGAIP